MNVMPHVPSKKRKVPSLRRHAFRWRITTAGETFFFSSGFPFFTVARTYKTWSGRHTVRMNDARSPYSRIGEKCTSITYHVSNTGGRKSIQSTLDLGDGDDVKVLCSGVIGAVHDGSYWETQRDAELGSARSTSSSLRHIESAVNDPQPKH